MKLEGGKYILGVDPGLSGALALYDPLKQTPLGLWSTPLTPSKTKKNGVFRKDIDLPSLAQLIDGHAPTIGFAIVEQVGAMPGQGTVSMFRFGQSLGAVSGILASSMIPTYYVSGSVWKSAMGLSRDKKDSINKAIGFFPAFKDVLYRSDGKSEALLLAVFAANMAQGKAAGQGPSVT